MKHNWVDFAILALLALLALWVLSWA